LELDARVKGVLQDMFADDAADVPRTMRRVCYDEIKPVGTLGRRLVDMKKAKRPLADVDRLLDEIRDVVHEHLYHEPRRENRIA
jgi:hypothetical protein